MNKIKTTFRKIGTTAKKHLLTAISYMLPLVVASGLLIAIGNLMGGQISYYNIPNEFS